MIVGLIWKYPCTILSRIPANSFQGTHRVPIDNLRRDFLNRFPDHHEIKNDRLACFPITEQLLVRYAVRIGLYCRDCVIDIREVEFHLPFRHR